MIQEVLVAVYGSLRKGLGNHPLLERNDAQLLSTEQIKGFQMYSLGGFPFITPDETAGDITIEVYAMPITGMRSLDALEGYPSFYDRMLVNTSKGQAWIYFIADRDGDYPLVEHGDWVRFKQEKYGSR